MTVVTASAPGKLVLCGEYAVLDDAPAICMAVSRRVAVRISSIDGDWHRVSAPGYSNVEGQFVANGAAVDWIQAADEYAIVDAVWRSLQPTTKGSLSIEMDSRPFVDLKSGAKIGIGSSAALTVALVGALNRSRDVCVEATRAHLLFQDGRGSGADIATCVTGGLIEFRGSQSTIASLHWPDGLAYRLIWTGVPANTITRLAKLESMGQRASRLQLSKAAERMAKAWRAANSVLHEYPAYIETLRQFSVDHDLGIFDAGHNELAIEAVAAGLVYKPCGAGGGDVGVLLGPSEEQLDDFVTCRVASGCQVLDCELDLNGIELEQS